MARPPGHVTKHPTTSHHEEVVNKTSPESVTKSHRKEAQVRGARFPHQLTDHLPLLATVTTPTTAENIPATQKTSTLLSKEGPFPHTAIQGRATPKCH